MMILNIKKKTALCFSSKSFRYNIANFGAGGYGEGKIKGPEHHNRRRRAHQELPSSSTMLLYMQKQASNQNWVKKACLVNSATDKNSKTTHRIETTHHFHEESDAGRGHQVGSSKYLTIYIHMDA